MNQTPQRTNQKELVERVFALTREIDEAAELSDWRRAARLTEERSPLLHAITAQQEPAALALIRQIQDRDAARLHEAAVARTELTAEYRAAIGGVKAATQYHRVAQL
jgi:flagellar protein FliT